MNSHVLYLAHGSYRVRAAREHVKRLAKSGVRVLLVVPGTEDWADVAAELDDLDNFAVVQLVPHKHRSVQNATKKLVQAKSGPAAAIATGL
ncbi:hypothetical protein ACFTXM_30875, partial [Streptomyces sp. NPDC056930]|uniref:hypothetical protein n=1 Tax=Streptomyces sp. NPDC056930 TaxID=3345967 RepID=UPI0036451A14